MKYKLKTVFTVVIISIIMLSCNKVENFQSDFETSTPRTWIGAEYWANPLQDWQVANGELECLVSKKKQKCTCSY